MTMNFDTGQASGILPPTNPEKRFGLVAARVGTNHAHRLGIRMPLEAPLHPTASPQNARPRARTAIVPTATYFERDANGVVVAALPGATVQLEVQDASLLSALSPEEQSKLRWVCHHPNCTHQRWTSRTELLAAHGDNRHLVEEARRSPSGQPHLYMGVVEVEARTEKSADGKTKVDHPAIVMLVSEEL